MIREDIIRMAREAEFHPIEGGIVEGNLLRFAALVAAAEREECCGGDVLNAANINGGDYPHQVVEKYRAAIRARRQQ
jgi:hypothetical protein